ncbi:hypothetical protein MTO96_024746 [Rhipicephalus appendiculatus]
MVVSTPNEENAARYVKIQEISIQGKHYEVSAYRKTPHDTVKGAIRGIPADANAEELDTNIVNERNPARVDRRPNVQGKIQDALRYSQATRIRRQVECQPSSESDFPPLDKLPVARKSRTPSKNRAPKSRDSSKRSFSKKRLPSCVQVGPVDAAKENSTRSAQKTTEATKKDDMNKVREANETLRQENGVLRTTINNLTREIAEIRKLLLGNTEPP